MQLRTLLSTYFEVAALARGDFLNDTFLYGEADERRGVLCGLTKEKLIWGGDLVMGLDTLREGLSIDYLRNQLVSFLRNRYCCCSQKKKKSDLRQVAWCLEDQAIACLFASLVCLL